MLETLLTDIGCETHTFCKERKRETCKFERSDPYNDRPEP